jgi:Zn-dependent protease
MGWQERQYRSGDDEGGGFRRALRRIFVEGDSFLSWAFPIFTLARVRVKVHLIFVLVVIGQLLISLRRDGIGFWYGALSMAALFLLVLLHEFGHILACRKAGGEADEILMWPLGGLASCNPPNHWMAHFITVIGGPAVNLALVPVFATIVVGFTRTWDAVVFNPFEVGRALAAVRLPSGEQTYWLVFLWWLYLTNWMLLAFNVLLPMYPMDGGRIVQSLLWWRIGYGRSMYISVNLGLGIAVVLGVLAAIGGETMLLAIAIFAGFTCWDQKRRLRFIDEPGYLEALESSRRQQASSGPSRRERRQREQELKRQAEVDRILQKIASEGMGSLSRREKALLRGETERKRRG